MVLKQRNLNILLAQVNGLQSNSNSNSRIIKTNNKLHNDHQLSFQKMNLNKGVQNIGESIDNLKKLVNLTIFKTQNKSKLIKEIRRIIKKLEHQKNEFEKKRNFVLKQMKIQQNLNNKKRILRNQVITQTKHPVIRFNI